MKLQRLREVTAALRGDEDALGLPPTFGDIRDALLLLALLAGIDGAPDAELDGLADRALAATSRGPWEHVGGRMLRCRPGGDTVPARSTQDAAHIAGCDPDTVLALVRRARQAEAAVDMFSRGMALLNAGRPETEVTCAGMDRADVPRELAVLEAMVARHRARVEAR